MSQRRVSWVISNDISQWEKNLRKATRDMQSFGRDVQRVGKDLSKYLTLPALAAGGALLGMAHKAAGYADEIDKAAIRSGLGRGELQELRFVAEQVGVSFEGLTATMESFTRRIPQIESGSGRSAEAFNRLGVRLHDSQGELRAMNQLFPEMVRGLAQIENVTERNAIATQIFGRRAFEIVPLIEAGADSIEELTKKAHDLGLVMDDESVADLVKFKDEWSATRQSLEAASREIAMGVLPLLRDDLIPIIQDKAIPAVRQFAQWFRNLDDQTKRNIVTYIGYAAVIGPVVVGIGGMIRVAASLTNGLRVMITTVRTLTAAMAANPWGAAIVALTALASYLVIVNRRLKENRNLINEVLDMEPTGTQQELRRIRDAIVANNAEIESTRRLMATMGAEESAYARQRIQNLQREQGELIELLKQTGAMAVERRKEAGAAEEQADAADDLLSALEDEKNLRAGLNGLIRQNNEELTKIISKVGDLTGEEITYASALKISNDEMQRTINLRRRLLSAMGVPEGRSEGQVAPGEARAQPVAMGSILEGLGRMPDSLDRTVDAGSRLNEVLSMTPDAIMESAEAAMFLEHMARDFTNSFGAGMANVIVQGDRLQDVLKNIGKLLASSAIQTGIRMLLMGATGGLGGGGITGGLLGSIFSVNDALIRSDGSIVKFHPNDSILAMQDFGNLFNSPMGPDIAGGSQPIVINNRLDIDGSTVWRNQKQVQYGKSR